MRKDACFGLWLFVGCVVAFAGCAERTPPPTLTRLVIDTTPQGAEVLVSGAGAGVTPLTVDGVEPGALALVFRKEGYKRKDEWITVQEGGEQRVAVELQPLVGYLSVETLPPGAEVVVDGEGFGSTPLFNKPIPVGERTLELLKENFYPLRATLTVEDGFRYEPIYQLSPMESTLSILSRPTGANVWVNNEPQGKQTPLKLTVPPGPYMISVHSDGYIEEDRSLTLAANDDVTVMVELKEGNVPAGMVLVPAGTFLRGADNRAPDESPGLEVYLDAYYIDKYEVTNAQFQQVFPKHIFPVGHEQYPVSGVSWEEATRYASAVGKRLPTELEWERAARGTDGREFPWGQVFRPEKCNTEESNLRGVVRVGTYLDAVSPAGCFDMAGNVYEWTASWYEAYPENTAILTSYGQIYRVLRGGSFMTPEFQARCAMRHFDRMDAKRADYGFRCARDVEVSSALSGALRKTLVK